MNVYQHKFKNRCPRNGLTIQYALEVRTDQVVYAEEIVAACRNREPDYHENIADDLHRTLGGQQTLRAYHHGVLITSFRGFE